MTRKGQSCAPLKGALSLFFPSSSFSPTHRSEDLGRNKQSKWMFQMVVFIVFLLLCFTMTYISKHEQQEVWLSPYNYYTVVYVLNSCQQIGIWLIRVRWVIKFKLLHSRVLRMNWGVSLPEERSCFVVWWVSTVLKQSLLCLTIIILIISLA